ncbi:FtsZ/tubulin family protein [Algoriphagus formosus]|uniref:hypothetical protein n=1 Tax=Algoriphagus formosus TaxID=2007308 RepID=UPI000C28F715|nr:hypothetical protein [Algoriphagus formosus]
MERRKFLKTLSLAAGSTFAITHSLAKSEKESRHLIALGTAACHFAAKNIKELPFQSVTLIDGERPTIHNQEGEFIRFSTPDSLFESIGSTKILKNGNLPILPISSEIDDYLRSLKGDLVFLAGLGKATGTLLFQSIGMHYQNPKQNLEWIGTLPFEFEGSRKSAHADLAIHLLAENGKEPSVIYSEEIRKTFGNISIRTAYELLDQRIFELFKG